MVPRQGIMKVAPAIIGMGCRYRGRVGPAGYWDLLTGRDLIKETALERVAPDCEGHDEVETSLAIDLAREALADAADHGLGLGYSTIGLYVARARLRADGRIGQLIAPAIARQLDLRGPILDVDAECASALVAVSHACAAIQTGLCQAAIVVAVRSASTARELEALTRSGSLSADARSRPFDRLADGHGVGEGGGAILLATSSAARYGDIIGTAVGHVGNSTPGFAVGYELFADLVRRLCAEAAPAETLGYVEAHAIGSRIGDELEVLALAEGLPRTGSIRIGSVKALIGHLEAASGMAALQKVALMARHGTIPACSQPESIVPALADPLARLALATEAAPWSADAPAALTVAIGQSGTISLAVLARPATLSTTDAATRASASPAAPQTDKELADSWSMRTLVLGVLVDVLGVTTDAALKKLETGSFFELGLDSIKAATAAQRLTDELGVTVSPTLFFKRSRLAALVAELVALKANDTPNATLRALRLETLILAEP